MGDLEVHLPSLIQTPLTLGTTPGEASPGGRYAVR
jgi:hypothetical protein